jgi:hypothetical protein
MFRLQARGDRTSLLTLIRAHSAMERSSKIENRTRELLTATRSVSETFSHQIHRLFSANVTQPRSIRRARNPEQLQTLATRDRVVEHFTRVTSVAHPEADRIRYRFDRIQLPFRRQIAPAVPASSEAGAATRRLAPPELVWAAASQAETVEPVERYLSSPAPTVLPSPSPANLDDALETASVVRTQMLDPVLIDRVAEDVMGRMERRMRIERERRGLTP